MFVVLFEVYPHMAEMHRYLDVAKLLRPELEQIDGFIDNERFVHIHNPQHLLSLSTWRDEKALIRWRTHAHHHQVQELGRSLIFADYRLHVGELITDTLPTHGHQLRQQRFDETETSSTKLMTLLELGSADNDTTVDNQVIHAATIDSPGAPAGWRETTHFTSLYHPGKRVMLGGWDSLEAAQAWHAARIAPIAHPSLRSRCVRVIRAYGMRDRHEAPQYYPDVGPAPVIW